MSSLGLKKSVVHGFLWSAIERFSQIGIRFVIQIILARLLEPEAFGLLAMVIVFSTIGIGLMDSGFTQVVIQRRSLSQIDLCTIFYTNLFFAALITLIIWTLAPWVAVFYNEPQLQPVLRVLAFSVILTGISRIHMSQFMRTMQFRKISYVNLPSKVVAAIISVYMAYQGYGVWALVAFTMCSIALESISLWIFSDWRPSLCYSFESLKSIFPFGSQMALVRAANLVAENMYFLVIGRYFSTIQVGYYQRASAFRKIASEELFLILDRVTFPLFSKFQDDRRALKNLFIRFLKIYVLFFSVIMGVLSGIAHPLIVILLGEKWIPSVLYLQLLCPIGVLYVINRLGTTVMKASGYADQVLRLTLIEHVFMFLGLMCSAPFGILPIIFTQIGAYILVQIPRYRWIVKRFKLTARHLIESIIFPTLYGMIFFGGAFSAVQISSSVLKELIASVLVLAGIFILCSFQWKKMYRKELILIIDTLPQLGFLRQFL